MKPSLESLAPPASLLDLLQGSRRPLLIAHIAPDGDAIGSLLGMGLILYQMGKEPVIACQDRVPHNMRFLPHQERVVDTVDGHDVDVVISLDSSDPSRMGTIYDSGTMRNLPVVVIDHHITNLQFGDINWVEPSAPATTEMIFYLAKSVDVSLDREIATCLLTGLVTDTRGFRTSNTTPRTMKIASDLMAAGAPLNQITERTLNSHSLDLVKLWGQALDTVEVSNGVVYADNLISMRQNLGGIIRAEGLVSFLLGIYEAKISVVFTELPEGQVECSFRAKPGNDVATIALELGGGGHPLASGCTVDGDMPGVRVKVLDLLRSNT